MRMLEVRDASIRFGGVQALDGVSLEVGEWEIVGILGPNGAGKTTLFNAVSGFARLDTGRVLIRGRDVTHRRPDQRAHAGLGRTFQQGGLVASFTVVGNVIAAQHALTGYGDLAGLFGLPSALKRERLLRNRAMQVLEFMGLDHLADQPLGALPYGTLKTVEVAAALAVNPEIIILDEPLAGMAPEEAHAFGDRLLAMRRELELSIVVVDHHVPQVLRVSDHIYVLNFGQVLAAGPPETVRADPAVTEAYLGKEAS